MNWVFASSYAALEKWYASHQQIGGVKPALVSICGSTAEYPTELATQFAQLTLPLLSHQGIELNLDNFEAFLPIKCVHDPLFPRQAGAGFPSQSD